ncbi:MAG: ubiquinol-cytochrome c reductase iron-sulfur subunit [Pseudomonadota bacterium]
MTTCASCSCGGSADPKRRQLLFATSAAAAAAGLAVAVPFVSTFSPSERARAAGAPVEADVSRLAPGEMMVVEWRGKPVWIVRRTPEMLATLDKVAPKLADPDSQKPQQPDYATNTHRSIKPEYFVAIGICTHLGCSPTEKFEVGAAQGMSPDWDGGFFCPCHGSQFDLAGRVLKNMPAPTNLEIPPHQYLAEARLLIGEDKSTV